MVKRTLIVLSILSLMVFAAGTSSAFVNGWPCEDTGCSMKPLFVPVDCIPYPEAKTIIKTWSCKIEGPCPGPAPCAAACKKEGFAPGMLCTLAGAIASPFDLLFGGFDGTYGCFPKMGGAGCDGADGSCGPCWGPVPAVAAALPMVLGAPTVMFGSLW
jgi:hypothetical protein